ncbi:RseA family anti-sigma factor [Blastopirellula marina]|uniref:Anti sigma-E protein RseA N-terminal domain-containing protein n=1 Tax=Blastopirellula marina TaxID=124 RepID=A0A2S8FF80_9BACT|nr:RseA family anti-sigma factor [Blastopirellula marina]PQO30802.1 hypothetical protein C5Y98_20615 [Blastopirellula marina]PTL42655.1 hypothetical protein C5Y97_20625 [Blastopirellula marina]
MNAGIPEELLSAYLDGQLGRDETQRVKTALAENPALRQQLQGLSAARDAVRSLPKATVGRDLTASIFAEITQRSTAAAETPQVDVRPTPASRVADRHRRDSNNGRSWQWIGIGAAAAALVAALIAIPAWLRDNRDANDTPIAQVDPQDKPDVQPTVKPGGDETKTETTAPDSTDRNPNFTELMGTGGIGENSENPNNSSTKPDRNPGGLRIKITSNDAAEGKTPETMGNEPVGGGSIARTTPDLSAKLDSTFDRFLKPTTLSEENRIQLLGLIASGEEVTDSEMLAGIRKLTEAFRSADEELVDLAAKLDLDEDNQLGSRELASCLAEARKHETDAGLQAARIFFRIDSNQDGVWTEDEVTKSVRLAGGPDKEFARKIRLWDQNHDGVVNFVEAEFSASALVREFQPIEDKLYDSQILAQAQRLIASSDRSGDGVLSGRELTKALEQPEIAAAVQDRKSLTLRELYLHLESTALGL